MGQIQPAWFYKQGFTGTQLTSVYTLHMSQIHPVFIFYQ